MSKGEMGGELPEGWTTSELGAVVASMANGVYKPEGYYRDDGIACLRMYNIEEGRIAWRNIKRMRLTPSEVAQFQLLPNDILVNRVNSRELVGKAAICGDLPEPVVFESKNIRVRLICDAVDARYVNYWLRADETRQRMMDGAKQTVGMATVSQPTISALAMPFPPLAEQRRIVAQVEALLARVQAARARLAKVPALLKRFRQSVLAAACSGELTADWREQQSDASSAAALLDSLHAARDGSTRLGYEIPESWPSATCGALCRKDRALTYGVIKLGAPVDDGVPTLRSSDVRHLRIDESSVKRISPEIAADYRRTFLEGGEIVVTVRGTLGGVAVVPPSMRGYNVSREVAVIPIHSKLDARFFCLAIASLPSQNWLTGVEKGVAYTGINIEDLKCLPLPVPPLEEQREIVRRVDALFALADKIETRVVAATARVEKITQAILAKAFRGQLVPTEAELARLEGRDYEPASVLLQRIRAERTQAQLPVNRKRRRAAEPQ